MLKRRPAGTICWTVQLIPQLWHTYRTKSVEGLSEIFVYDPCLQLQCRPADEKCFVFYCRLACGVAGAFLGTYSVVQNLNIPLILQPQLFGVLCLASWAQVGVILLVFTDHGRLTIPYSIHRSASTMDINGHGQQLWRYTSEPWFCWEALRSA